MGASGIIFRDLILVRFDLDLALDLFIMGGPAWMVSKRCCCWNAGHVLIRSVRTKRKKGLVQPGARARVPLSASCAPASDTNSLSPLPLYPSFTPHPTSSTSKAKHFNFRKIQDDHESSKPCWLMVLIPSFNTLE